MMKFLFSIAAFLFTGNSWGLDTTSVVYKYHKEIADAEYFVLHGDYQNALQRYQSAFNQGNKPFATDLYNGLVVAVLMDNDSLTELFAIDLAEKGVGADFFEKRILFRKYAAYPFWGRLVKKAAASKNRFKILNAEMVDRISLMSFTANDLHKKWAISIDNGDKKENDLEKAMNIQSRFLITDLIDFMDKYGYPSEDKIGVSMINDTVISFEPVFSRIILSSYSQPNGIGGASMTPYLVRALDSGLIKPGYYARMRDFQNFENFKTFGTNIFSGFRGVTYFRTSDGSPAALDLNRKEIGLPPLTEYAAVISYSLKNPNSPFLFYFSYVSQDPFFKSDEDIRNYLKTHREYSALNK